MPGITTRSTASKLLWPGVRKILKPEYKEYPLEYTQVYKYNKSTRAYEEDYSMTGLGFAQLIEEGDGVKYDMPKGGFTWRYVHMKYGLGFMITKEAIDDNQYDRKLVRGTKDLVRSLRHTKEWLGANAFNRAFNPNYTYGDGVPLISNAHPRIKGGTWSNRPTVDADISEAAIEQARIDIAQYVDDNGFLMNLNIRKLIHPVQSWAEIGRLLYSPLRPGTSNNDSNEIRRQGVIPMTFEYHYLTDPDVWFLELDTADGMNYFDRQPDKFSTDDDFDTDNAKFKGVFRCSFGCSDPRCLYGSPGA